MSTELALFLLAVIYVALAFGLGYVVGANRTLKAVRAKLPRAPKPYDWQGDR